MWLLYSIASAALTDSYFKPSDVEKDFKPFNAGEGMLLLKLIIKRREETAGVTPQKLKAHLLILSP